MDAHETQYKEFRGSESSLYRVSGKKNKELLSLFVLVVLLLFFRHLPQKREIEKCFHSSLSFY